MPPPGRSCELPPAPHKRRQARAQASLAPGLPDFHDAAVSGTVPGLTGGQCSGMGVGSPKCSVAAALKERILGKVCRNADLQLLLAALEGPPGCVPGPRGPDGPGRCPISSSGSWLAQCRADSLPRRLSDGVLASGVNESDTGQARVPANPIQILVLAGLGGTEGSEKGPQTLENRGHFPVEGRSVWCGVWEIRPAVSTSVSCLGPVT